MKQKMLIYLKGLGWTYLTIIIFSAVGWINIGEVFFAGKMVIPLLMAFVIWTAMYILGYAVWAVLIEFAGCTSGIGFLIGLGVLGYGAIRLSAYVLPNGWVTFTGDEFALFLMGGSIALIYLAVDEERRSTISVSLLSRKHDDRKGD